MYSKKKIIRNVILVVALLLILVITAFSLGDIKEIWKVLTTQTNYWYVLICLLCVLVYCFLMQASLTLLVKKKCKEISFKDAMYISGSEYFFNGVTPFSTGGQPFQAYALKQKNMKFSDSTSTLLINFLAYQIVINLYSLICICIYYGRLKGQVENLSWLVILGFTINTIIMVFAILIGTTKFFGRFLIKIIVLFSKIKFLKKFLEPRISSFEIYIEETQTAFKEIYHNKAIISCVFLLKVLAMLVYYAIPFFIFYAIGVDLAFENIFYVISMTSFALTITTWVPTPGASGGVELAFSTLFVVLLKGYPDVKNLTISGMLLWRLLTYYFLLFYGLAMYLLFERRNKNENRNLH